MEKPKIRFSFSIYKFSYNFFYYLSTLLGLHPQIRLDNKGRIKRMQTLRYMLLPLVKTSLHVLYTIYYYQNDFKLYDTPSATLVLYRVGLSLLYLLHLIRCHKMQKIYEYQELLLSDEEVNPSWNSLMVWPLLFMYGWGVAYTLRLFIEHNVGLFRSAIRMYLTGEILDLLLTSFFIGSSLFLYEGACKKVLKLMNQGKYQAAMALYEQLLENFKAFDDVMKYEVVGNVLLTFLWIVRNTALYFSVVTYYFKSADSLSRSKILDFFSPFVTEFGRTFYICTAASALYAQNEEIIDKILDYKVNSCFKHDRSKDPRRPGYSQVDIRIQLSKMRSFNLSGFGFFDIRLGLISGIIEILIPLTILRYKDILVNGY